MKIRLLLVINNLAFGGGERVFAQIINGLPRNNYEIFLASQPGGHLYRSIHNNKIHYIPLDFSKRVNFSPIFKLFKAIKKYDIHLVHSQGSRADFYSRISARLAGNCKMISTVAAPIEKWDVNPIKKCFYYLLDRFSEKFVDRFITVSQELVDILVSSHKLNKNIIIKIPNGVELDKYSIMDGDPDLRKALGISPDDYVVGAIGRLVWEKGFNYLLSAFKKIHGTIKNSRLVIVGDGPMEKRLLNQANELGIKESVIFTGFIEDVRPLMTLFDVLAFPSISEGSPMTTLEAMAMEKPIVATSISGIKEQIIDGESGILIPPRDPAALAEAICNILNNDGQMNKLGLNARRRIDKYFSVEKMVAETRRVYQSLL